MKTRPFFKLAFFLFSVFAVAPMEPTHMGSMYIQSLKQLLLVTVKHNEATPDPTCSSKDPNLPTWYDRRPKVSSLMFVGWNKGIASDSHPSDPSCLSGEAAG